MRILRLSLLFLSPLLLASVGCKEDETIQQYRVAHNDRIPLQLRVAIIPYKEWVYFIRMSGPEDAMKQHLPAFEAFVRSVNFNDAEKPRIKLTAPKEWE